MWFWWLHQKTYSLPSSLNQKRSGPTTLANDKLLPQAEVFKFTSEQENQAYLTIEARERDN